jgi:Ca2+/Na+ antiporter
MKQWQQTHPSYKRLLIAVFAATVLSFSLHLNLHLLSKRHDDHFATIAIIGSRKLNDAESNNSADAPDDNNELPPCSDILLHQSPSARCHHAANCQGEYLMRHLLPYAFCLHSSDTTQNTSNYNTTTTNTTTTLLLLILLPLSITLLFRLLSSTSENYFSPALEMLSSTFQIPPPLAGVTLLALGNGSPDVSSVVNAIKSDPREGCLLSLGELTGGGMFVQCVVVGRIVSIGRRRVNSGNNDDNNNIEKENGDGVTCHAELIRDMTMYAISASYVCWMCHLDTIYYRHVVCMFVIYGVYVGAVVLFEIRRYYSNSSGGDDGDVSSDEEGLKLKSSVYTSPDDDDEYYAEATTFHDDAMEPTSSYDDEDQSTLELSQSRQDEEAAASKQPQDRPGSRDPPGSKHSARIIRVIKIQEERSRNKKKRRMMQQQQQQQIFRPDYSQRTFSIALFTKAIHELIDHLQQVLFTDGCGNKDLSTLERILVSLESPFVILRKFVTPLPCEGDYHRAMVAFSIALSPIWLCFYLAFKLEDFDPFHVDSDLNHNGSSKAKVPLVFWPLCLSTIIGYLVLRYAPMSSENDSTTMPLRYTVPVALYGFLIAATWIDVISDQLVNVLEFVGLVLRVPSPIMGLTVLAWGNSVGDYSTNSALAYKGFSSMSMAACFAGPSFNLLIGLGLGLLSQKELLMSEDGLSFISLVPSVKTGFLFLISNCLLAIASGIYHKGVIPAWSSKVFFAVYMCYMTLNAQLLVM